MASANVALVRVVQEVYLRRLSKLPVEEEDDGLL